MPALRWQYFVPVLSAGVIALIGWATGYPGFGIVLGLAGGGAISYVFARQTQLQMRAIEDLLENRVRPRELVRTETESIDDLEQSIRRFMDLEQERLSYEQSEAQRQSQLLDRMSDGVMRVDANGIVVYANLAASAMFGGRNPGGRSFIAVVRDHELDDLLRACLATGNDQQRTMDLPNERRVVNAVLVRLGDSPPEVLVVLRDVTELTRLQTLRRDFVANVSHELRTPLSTIKILNETLLDLTPEVSEEHRFLTKVESEIDSMIELVDDLMQLARLESERSDLVFEEVMLGDLVSDVRDRMQPIAERQSVVLESEVQDPERRIYADGRRLRQALLNLTHNAIVHTDVDGAVRIECHADGDQTQFRVIDTGRGISPDDLSRIWERFYKADRSRAAPGTGLGLAIVKHIALAHGGDVEARSEPSVGSEFRLTIPNSALPQETEKPTLPV